MVMALASVSAGLTPVLWIDDNEECSRAKACQKAPRDDWLFGQEGSWQCHPQVSNSMYVLLLSGSSPNE